jgi:outer membrane lipoprotein-sorting protein
MEMRVADKPGEFTKITYRKLKLNVDIPASKFTEAELRR